MKTPLSIINANYDALLVNQEETIQSQKKWLNYIKIGTDRMKKLINDLLISAKIEEVNLEICKMPFNLSNTINEQILSIEAAAIEKGITLIKSIEPDIIVNSDSESIKQVVTILFDNAIKYKNENGQIDISLTKSKHQIIYSIKNTGKGIAKKDLPKIFDRFYRTDPSRTQDSGGFGLGLSIAKTMIDRLGGRIYVTSIENESTTFTITLEL
ncbi:sensor histidine kinase [Bacillus chungangensis]|uniref:histidine kinase n=1 Tax=Bacillus chungangensis TaxID=587633 RepID=A0ABT9WLQ4_9BACI|nr:HAMP domain-containing sensor histidine kinase [Bacillus chungangensis]MDQ0174220.1 signal transduction histidine kinase [Bacillus chungangensis]